jgi:hypothetical protein
VRLKYTGTQATTFQEPGVGHVEPGGEFEVPADRLLSFMRRADIEHAAECPSPPCKCGQEPEPPAPAAKESGTAKHAKAKAAPATAA